MPSRTKIQPIAQKAYNQLAEPFSKMVDTKPHNAYYERPATLSLLPDLEGKRVLDAGCGPGVYAEWLVAHGAAVVAFDANRKMVRLARQRLGNKAQVVRAALEDPLDFAADASFDIIVSALVMHYVKDWEPPLREFYRVIKTGGCLVFSIQHPFNDYEQFSRSRIYFEVELVDCMTKGFGKSVCVPFYRRPLGVVINSLIAADFCIDTILEPLPTEEFKRADPEDYAELIHKPGFMCIRATKK